MYANLTECAKKKEGSRGYGPNKRTKQQSTELHLEMRNHL